MAAKDFDFVFQPFHTLDLVELPIYDNPWKPAYSIDPRQQLILIKYL